MDIEWLWHVMLGMQKCQKLWKFNYAESQNEALAYLHRIVAYIDFLGIVGAAVAWTICYAIAEKLAQNGVGRRRLPRDVHRAG